MVEPVSIGAGLGALKTATTIAKALRDLDKNIQAAEFKMKIADLMEALSEARIELVELEGENLRLKEEIRKMEAARDVRGEIELREGAYFPRNGVVDGHGKGPWCSRCYEVDGALISLHHKVAAAINDWASYCWKCPSCETSVPAPSKVR